jgi:hypothetical protein
MVGTATGAGHVLRFEAGARRPGGGTRREYSAPLRDISNVKPSVPRLRCGKLARAAP